MGEEKELKLETRSVKGYWDIQYRWRFNTAYLARYAQGLKDKKILGTRCPKCQRVFVPPTYICGRCLVEIKDWVELKGEAELIAYTVAYSAITGEELKEPNIIGMIKFEGADSWSLAQIKEIKPEEVRIGIKLKPVWKEERKGQLGDIKYFVPA